MQEFSELFYRFRDTSWRQKLIYMLVIGYNCSNVALYFESPNEFLEHYGVMDHRLTQFSRDNSLQIVALSAISFFTMFLFYSNHKSYCHHIDKILPEMDADFYLEEGSLLLESTSEPEPARLDFILSVVSATYKAAVASSSLLAFLKNSIHLKAIWAFSGMIACAPGNFIAQFSIFVAPLLEKYHWHIADPRLRAFFSHFLACSYNIPNTALYFNAADDFLRYLNYFDHRIHQFENDGECFLLISLIVCSVFLFFATQRSYSEKISDIFTAPDERKQINIASRESNCFLFSYDKLTPFFAIESRFAALYKSMIHYISLVSVLFSVADQRAVAFSVAALCIPGNLIAQFSILKPTPSRQQLRDSWIDPKRKSFSSSGWGLFSWRARNEEGSMLETSEPRCSR